MTTQSHNPTASIETPEPEIATQIAEYYPIARALHDLYTRHAGVVHDVTTTKGMQACREARAEIRTCRTSLEVKRKEIKAPALERCRLIDADAKRITEALLAIEDPLDVQIKAEEGAAEARRDAKRRAEMERLARLNGMLADIRGWPLAAVGATAQEIRDQIGAKFNIGEMPEEIRDQCTEAAEQALEKLRHMLTAREQQEAEEARQAAARAERERFEAAERARYEREKAEEMRQQALERERLYADRRRLAEEQARVQREAQEAEQRLAYERATMERELDEERARIKGMDGGPAPDTWIEVADVFPGREPGEGAEPTQAEPSDAVVLRDLAHVLERGGEPYDWIPNRLRMIADRLQDLESDPVGARSSECPW